MRSVTIHAKVMMAMSSCASFRLMRSHLIEQSTHLVIVCRSKVAELRAACLFPWWWLLLLSGLSKSFWARSSMLTAVSCHFWLGCGPGKAGRHTLSMEARCRASCLSSNTACVAGRLQTSIIIYVILKPIAGLQRKHKSFSFALKTLLKLLTCSCSDFYAWSKSRSRMGALRLFKHLLE